MVDTLTSKTVFVERRFMADGAGETETHIDFPSLDLIDRGGILERGIDPRNVNFTFSKYSGVATAGVWTYGWMRIADATMRHWKAGGDNGAEVNVVIALLGVLSGCALIWRFFPRHPGLYTTKPAPPEPWYRRVTGWLAATVWCAAGALWNTAIYKVLLQSADKGQTANFLILIPFEVAGFFLLLVLFVGATVVLDFIFRLEHESSPPAAVPPLLSAEKPAPTPASPPAGSPDDVSKGVNPMFALLLVATIINWFVFFGISMYLGGDAVGILPSQDGFVVKSHGHHTAVSEAAWAFSLVYSTATLLGTPAIWISFGVWEACSGKKKLFTSPKVWVIGLFLLVWATGWYWGIGSSFYNSYNDWQKFKHAPPSVHSQQP